MKFPSLFLMFLLFATPGFAYHADAGDAKAFMYGGVPTPASAMATKDGQRSVPQASDGQGSKPSEEPARVQPAH